MLLTIHNLPHTIRYSDIKSLLLDKCGLTEIILDNLVSEGKGKKVTVGLANDDDGALVVRKINGLYLSGQQLYIEDKRRKTGAHDQPYRSSASYNETARAPEQTQPTTIMGGVPANMAVAWNYNQPAFYVAPVPIDQSLAFSSYGGASQAAQYLKPQPVVPVAKEQRGISGFQDQGHVAPGKGLRGPGPGDWGRSGREQRSDANRKRHLSPERTAVDSKRASRWGDYANQSSNRREASPPRQQWPQEMNQGPRPSLRQSEQLARNQNQFQPNREPTPVRRGTDPQWDSPPRWEESNPRSEREWRNDNNRDWEPGSGNLWEDQPDPQWRDEPREWDNQPNPQWEEKARSPMAKRSSGWYDRHPDEGHPPEAFPVQQEYDHEPVNGRYARESRPRQRNDDINRRRSSNERSAPNNWSRNASSGNLTISRSANSLSRQVRRENETQRWDRPEPSARQGRDWRDDRPNSSRARSGDERRPSGEPDWKQVANDYPASKKPEFGRRDAHKGPGPDRNQRKQDTYKKPIVKEIINKYPPVDNRRPPLKKPFEPRFESRKPQTLTSMINKDCTNRGQATALISKQILGPPSHPATASLTSFVLKQMKKCIRSRIDVILGEELSLDIDDVVKRYRVKFPISGDRTLAKQIREKCAMDYSEKQDKRELERGKEESNNGNEIVKTEPTDMIYSPTKAILDYEAYSSVPKDDATTGSEKVAEIATDSTHPLGLKLPKLKSKKPLTDKQIIKQMKLQRKEEYSQEDFYKLDDASAQAVDEELAILDKLFHEECSAPADGQDEVICKRILTDGLNDFKKTVRLSIAKRILNIPTGLCIRVFAMGKLPRKTSIKEYLKGYRIERMVLKKNNKGTMFVINLSRFEDYDKLCKLETDAIDGIPVTFKAMNLVGPPAKIPRNQVKQMRQRMINRNLEEPGLEEFEDATDFTVAADDAEEAAEADFTAAEAVADDAEEAAAADFTAAEVAADDAEEVADLVQEADIKEEETDLKDEKDFTEDVGDFTGDVGDFMDDVGDFTEDANPDGFNEDDLEDF